MDNFFLDFFAAAWKIFSLILTSMTPLFIGLIFAYIMNPAVEWVRKSSVRNGNLRNGMNSKLV